MSRRGEKRIGVTSIRALLTIVIGIGLVAFMPDSASAQDTIYLPLIAQSQTLVDIQVEADMQAEVGGEPASTTQAQRISDDTDVISDIFESEETIPLPTLEEQPVLPETNDAIGPDQSAPVSSAGANAVEWNVIGNWELSGRLGVGTEFPATKAHVVGNRIRLQNGAKIVDLRADGGAVDLQTSTDDLFLRSTGAGHDMFVNPFAADGRVYLGAGGTATELDVRGGIRTNGAYPVLIRRYENIGSNANRDTGISASSYHCVATGWSARWDIQENGSGFNTVWTYVNNNRWYLRVNFYHHNDPENTDVDLLCFRREIAFWSGASRGLYDPD